MPTDIQYRTAADDLRRQAWAHRDTVAWSPRRPAGDVTGPGPVADAIDDAHDRALRAIADAASDIDAAAAECERRAEVCRAYADELARYRALPSEVRDHLPQPVRPATWVDVR